MAKYCHEMHHVQSTSVIYVAFSGLGPSLMHHKSDGVHALYYQTDDVIIIMILEIILISNRRGCSIAVGS
jgi:hypothetical protein